ncbi:MAG: hypothetical protein H7Z15_04960 [Rhizobacter sp.]|nr:hypothetical protein [Rhizobacter sp.]
MMMAWAVAAVAGVVSAPLGAPPAGPYDARLCVTVASQAPNCGPAQAQISADGGLRVRIHDIAYHLSFEQGALLGITTHGNMQVADFVSSYRWAGTTLMFGDGPRGLQFELQLLPRSQRAAASATQDADAPNSATKANNSR